MKEVAPPKLYKYQSCNEYSFSNLRKGCLWFSKPQDFNDPFDCDINFEIVDVTQENLNLLFAHLRESAQDKVGFDKVYLRDGKINDVFTENAIKFSLKATNQVKKQWANIGVTCLSENNDDILMWSHYSYGHQGFCLEFDTSYSPFTETGKDNLIKIHYSDSYPPLSLSDILHKELPPLPRNLLATKSSHWSYEAEWRLFSTLSRIEYSYEKAALTGIYFGCNMKENDKANIASILAGSPTRLHQMHRSNDKFKVISNEIYSAA
ncbi:MAG: DUF2971 domain-containing protein [Chloroflexi bacterium]|nr:DUF2971 domain-containing protein [Chloroflexota bacterium]